MALENKFNGQVEFVVADVDSPQGQQLAARFAVNSIPAFFIMDGKGKTVFQDVGVFNEDTLANYLVGSEE